MIGVVKKREPSSEKLLSHKFLKHQLTRDHLALRLARAFANLGPLPVAIEALHGGSRDEPSGAVVGKAQVGDADGRIQWR